MIASLGRIDEWYKILLCIMALLMKESFALLNGIASSFGEEYEFVTH